MNKNEIIQALQSEAKANPASNAVFHVFAIRKRARNTVTLTALYNRMRREQFNYSKQEYLPVIKKLVSLGLGTGVYNKRSRLIGVKDLETTLQSIGVAACGDTNADLGKFKPRNKFSKVIHKNQIPALAALRTAFLNIEVAVNDKKIQIPIPKDLSTEDLAALLNRLQ